MILDGKSVQGIYLFNYLAKYEKGDFIVEDDCIYICLKDSIGNLPSLSPEYFSAYPGDRIAKASEYYNYLGNITSDSIDKYVSLKTLSEILQNAYYGYSETGIINDNILYTETKNLINYTIRNVNKTIDLNTSKDKVLDIVMRKPELNNGVMKVSSSLPELNNILLSKINDTGKIDDSIEVGTIILRQYTYVDSKYPEEQIKNSTLYVKVRIRIQELIDINDGQVYIRATKGKYDEVNKVWNYSGKISAWKCTIENKKLLDHINAIKNYYYDDQVNTEISTTAITDSFKYLELKNLNDKKFELSSLDFVGSDTKFISGLNRIKINRKFDLLTSDDEYYITLLIKEPIKDGTIYRNHSLTLDLFNSNDPINYMVGDNIVLTIKKENERATTLDEPEYIYRVSLSDSNSKITNVYYRKYEGE